MSTQPVYVGEAAHLGLLETRPLATQDALLLLTPVPQGLALRRLGHAPLLTWRNAGARTAVHVHISVSVRIAAVAVQHVIVVLLGLGLGRVDLVAQLGG